MDTKKLLEDAVADLGKPFEIRVGVGGEMGCRLTAKLSGPLTRLMYVSTWIISNIVERAMREMPDDRKYKMLVNYRRKIDMEFDKAMIYSESFGDDTERALYSNNPIMMKHALHKLTGIDRD